MTEKSKEPCWYVVHTYSGYENKVKDTLEKSVENNGMQDLYLRRQSACGGCHRNQKWQAGQDRSARCTPAMCWCT